MSNETKQTAVDLFHDKVNELIVGKKTITSNDLGKIWLECKEMEKSIIIEARQDGIDLISIGYPVFAEYDANNNEEWYEHRYGGK